MDLIPQGIYQAAKSRVPPTIQKIINFFASSYLKYINLIVAPLPAPGIIVISKSFLCVNFYLKRKLAILLPFINDDMMYVLHVHNNISHFPLPLFLPCPLAPGKEKPCKLIGSIVLCFVLRFCESSASLNKGVYPQRPKCHRRKNQQKNKEER